MAVPPWSWWFPSLLHAAKRGLVAAASGIGVLAKML
jgi:hypothetical protein